ncbi:hypothetical protein ACEWY4_007770 [Coilia grayii]|uniref:DDE Tnp4 domain-containing protein n=1 Tax=Coilia grayii TaxID=363190 RepID=A0ABD1K8Z8_9TELE
MDASRKAFLALVLVQYQALQNNYLLHLHNIEEEMEKDIQRRRKAVVTAVLQSRHQVILKSGIEREVMLEMDDNTFAHHFHIRRTRFEQHLQMLQEGGLQSEHSHGLPPLPVPQKALMCLWYMANQNREDGGLPSAWRYSAYIGQAFPFILTPKRDNGALTDADRRQNYNISRGRVIVEQAFGRMKCKWRRLRDLQNTRMDVVVMIIMAACFLHNFALGALDGCDEHPKGCPRQEDANE